MMHGPINIKYIRVSENGVLGRGGYLELREGSVRSREEIVYSE